MDYLTINDSNNDSNKIDNLLNDELKTGTLTYNSQGNVGFISNNNWRDLLDRKSTISSTTSSIYPCNNEYTMNFDSGGNEFEKIEFNPAKIQSSVYDYEVFAMLETMRQIIAESLGVSKEFFDKKYNDNKELIQQKYEDMIISNKVTKELLK